MRVFGEVEDELELTWEQFTALPRTSNVQDIHCVTRWSQFDTSFEGVHWRELAKLARPKPTARFVIAHAEPASPRTCRSSFLEQDDALLATHGDGEPLTPDHGYPLRLVVPGKYFWKSAKWLRGIELSLDRQARLLGALRLQQRRRPLAARSATASESTHHSFEGSGRRPGAPIPGAAPSSPIPRRRPP